MSPIESLLTLTGAACVGFLVPVIVHWRSWRDVLRARRHIQEGRRIERQFDRLNNFRVSYLDPRIGLHSTMSDEERARLDADVAWWFAASEETQRQADSWRNRAPVVDEDG